MNGQHQIDRSALPTSLFVKRIACLAIASFLAVFVSVPASANIQDNWQFDVYLDNKPIGEHSFIVSEKNGLQTIRTQASFDVKFLFVTAFSYRHENTETWQNGCLQEIEAKTKVNGKLSKVAGEQRDQNFLMSTNDKTESLKGCVSTFAYWDQNFLNNTQLLNSQTGELEPVVVKALGEDSFEVADKVIPATRYEITVDDTPISLWYSQDGRWLGLETLATGGRVLRYQPTQLPATLQTIASN